MNSSEDRPVQFSAAADERRFQERRIRPGVTRVELAPATARVSWSGVWGGFLIALGIWIVLATLGAAVGLSSINPGTSLSAAALSKGTTAWLYVSALIALFFGGVFGTRLAMVMDGAMAWLEATLIWTFALVLTILLATTVVSLAAANPAATVQVAQSNPGVATPGAATAGAWFSFVGMVIAWIVTVLGSFWGRSQARDRAHSLGLAA